jgi:cytidine deaminase
VSDVSAETPGEPIEPPAEFDFDAEALLAIASEMREHAYAPYSGFRVGAALLATDDRVFVGANVENAAYSTICAERVAMPLAIVDGARDFVALAVVGDGDGPCTPCGTCRQVLFEFAPDLIVLAGGGNGEVARYVLGHDLLPDGFGPLRLREGR